ncbi:alpha/beta-hydrolase [Stipitochalara longipes BDJ]|nr:alpha/beta-hydrolase [Stipitochalara longipes BDJ]
MTEIIKRAFWDAPEGQIHYRYILTTATEKKAPVIFLHQSASCGWAYQSMMKQYAARGHDCFAPDMPGFGASYDLATDPTSTRYYVDIWMNFIRHLKLPKMHLIGHHSGSAHAMEMAAVYPDEIYNVALSGPALMSEEEQAASFKAIGGEWSKPKEDGSHLMKVWNTLNGPLWDTLELKNHEVIDALRAWKGRDQAYGVSFVQPKLKYFKSITIPILAMCSKDDVLWPCFHYCKELQPEARCEVTKGNLFENSKEIEGSISYYHMDFLEKLGA